VPQELPKPTPAETAILNVLWDRGPSTVRQVLDALDAQRPTGYTTVLKLMQIMADKGLIERQPGEARAHTFAAVVERDATQRQMVRELVERIFGGSSTQMVLQALEECPATPTELEEIRSLIERRKNQPKQGGGA
jgi:predicted transcriptional regulator